MNTTIELEKTCALSTVTKALRTAGITASPEAVTVLAQLRLWEDGKQVVAIGTSQLTRVHFTDVMIERLHTKYELITNLYHVIVIVKLLAGINYRGLVNIAMDPVHNPALGDHLCVLCVDTISGPLLKAVEVPMQAFPKNTIWMFLRGRSR